VVDCPQMQATSAGRKKGGDSADMKPSYDVGGNCLEAGREPGKSRAREVNYTSRRGKGTPVTGDQVTGRPSEFSLPRGVCRGPQVSW